MISHFGRHMTTVIKAIHQVLIEVIVQLKRFFQRFAELLDRAWKLKRVLGSVSNSEIDDLYIAGKSLGAWGGKLLGAGGGGFVLFMIDTDLLPRFISRFGRSAVLPVSLINAGSSVIHLS